MAATKAELRRHIRAQRAGRAADPDEPATLLVAARAARLLGQPGRQDHPARIAAYIASPGEPDTGAIRSAVRAAGGTVLLPVPEAGGTLTWAADDGRYAADPRLPVLVPTGPRIGVGAAGLVSQGVSLVLVPALAVDRSGTRLGQGGGYYDRLLADLGVAGTGPSVVAVVHPDEVLAEGTIPRDAHDVPIPAALTGAGLVRLG